ncbi:MFS transporter [Ornithinimicrobium faecis]|uniref:MFS transporter n=1 Tax=Ornithinimicrobium faecis TaxID=2934158 RepID=UPI002117E9FD|nr:MFS transporter [Ornithinimicrobium sp. HY1745]
MDQRPGSRGAFADPAFGWLWCSFVLAQAGSALGAVAIPLIAINELGLDEGTIALLATASALVLLVAAFPAGYIAEFRRKRPLMIGADLVRAATFTAVAVLFVLGALHVVLLMLALAINAAMQILFGSASTAHKKDLLEAEYRADGLGKLQAAAWTAMIAGPVVAGVIAAATSPVVLLVGNAAAFVVSALLVHGIPRPEGATPTPAADARRATEAAAGLRFLLTQPLLRRLFLSWLLFAGAVAAMTPVTQVFYLQDLQFTEQQYGLLMGLPSVGGLIGSWMTGRVTRRWGVGPTLWWSSVLRTPWYLIFPLATAGTIGMIWLLVAFTGVLLFSSITNSAMSALRMDLTPDHLMSRTASAWTIATMGAGPALIPLIGLLMHHTDARTALWAIAILVVLSVTVLPQQKLRAPSAID